MAVITSETIKAGQGGEVRGRRSIGQTIVVTIAYVILVAVALLMFVPFLFSLATSFKTPPDALRLTFSSMFWPRTWTLDAYRTALDSNIQRWFINSAVVAAIWICG
ncbi:MAG TPA: hypothetical protein VFQ54_08085, partial [Thermomicrobiales bacterium]|nr:hypothetical protein [Thermomicrobiales bacterium]